MFNNFIRIYQSLQRDARQDKSYTFYPTDKDIKSINAFLSIYKDCGVEFLENYLTFQFMIYADLDTRFGEGMVMLNWVIGKKAIGRWKKRKDGANYYIDQNRSTIIKNVGKKRNKYKPSYFFKENKRRMAKKGEMYALDCMEINDFDPDNILCTACKYMEVCRRN